MSGKARTVRLPLRCRLFGHRWAIRKMGGRLCRVCREFKPYQEGSR